MSNNPLKNYFRKPVLTVKLPSKGQGYKTGTIELPESGELPIYPMTAIDEINARTPENLTNGKVLINLITSCVPNIKDPWEIPSIDLDTILLGIRIATSGKTLGIESSCPSCEQLNNHTIELFDIIKGIGNGNYDDPLNMNGLSIKFKPLNYRQIINANEIQQTIQKKIEKLELLETDEERVSLSAEIVRELNHVSVLLVGESIEYVKTPDSIVFEKEFIQEFLENCDKESFDKIKDRNIELRTETEIKPLQLKCTHCSHEYEFILDVNANTI